MQNAGASNANYIETIKKRFAENGGRLFVADASKIRSYKSVKAVFDEQNPSSSVCVVKNREAAIQIKEALYAGKDAKIISTVDEFSLIYKTTGQDYSAATVTAQDFKKICPFVIVTLFDNGDRPVLHHELTKTPGKAGEYNDGEQAPYCISNLLTDAKYDFVVIDNVYEMMSFTACQKDDIENKKPQHDERIDLLSEVYFTTTKTSYKRLSRLCDSADSCIVLSDVLVDRSVVTLYAGLSLVNSSFSYKTAKEFVSKRASSFVADCDAACGNISFGPSDGTILSLCLQKSKGCPQIIPEDLDSLGEYLQGNLDFMTHEETFLRIVYTQAEKKYKLNVSTNDAIIRNLEDVNGVADAFCDMFFADKLKGDIESVLKTPFLTRMSKDEYTSLWNIIAKYGVYCDFPSYKDKCSIVRIYHDDSAFEDIVRSKTEHFDREEFSYSASHTGDDMVYKAIATKDLLAKDKLKLPLLVVTKDKKSDVCVQLRKLLEDNTVTSSDSIKASLENDEIFVMEYKNFNSLANPLNAKSVVFFDAIADINKLDGMIKKSLELSTVEGAVLLVTYDNIEGNLMDSWQSRLYSEELKNLPVRNTDVYIKGDAPLDYCTIVDTLDYLYESLKSLAEGTFEGKIDALSEKYAQAISDFTLKVSAPAEEIAEDFLYFKSIAKHYSNIFTNSISVGTNGREVFSERPAPTAAGKKKGKNAKTVFAQENEADRIVFNVCTKQLHETCDYKNKDCGICDNCDLNTVNRFGMFVSGAKNFFKETLVATEKLKHQREVELMGRTIQGGGFEIKELDELILEIRKSTLVSTEALSELINLEPEGNGVFYVPCENVFAIREEAQKIYSKIFGKYYNELMDIFKQATDKMMSAFLTAGQSAKQSATAF